MDITIARIIATKEEAIKAINQAFSVIDQILEPGWNADLTVSLSCQGSKYRTDHPEDGKI